MARSIATSGGCALAPAWLDVAGSPEELGISIGDDDEHVWAETCSLELSPREAWERWSPTVCAGLGVDLDVLPMQGEPTPCGHLSWSICGSEAPVSGTR